MFLFGWRGRDLPNPVAMNMLKFNPGPETWGSGVIELLKLSNFDCVLILWEKHHNFDRLLNCSILE